MVLLTQDGADKVSNCDITPATNGVNSGYQYDPSTATRDDVARYAC